MASYKSVIPGEMFGCTSCKDIRLQAISTGPPRSSTLRAYARQMSFSKASSGSSLMDSSTVLWTVGGGL